MGGKAQKYCAIWFTTVEAPTAREAQEKARDEVHDITHSGDMLSFEMHVGKCGRRAK